MTPGEHPQALSAFMADVVVGTATDLLEGIERYGELLDQPDSDDRAQGARAAARRMAMLCRGLYDFNRDIQDEVPEELDPRRAGDTLRRLEYAFVALGQRPVDEPTVLSVDELLALVPPDLIEWAQLVRAAVTDGS